MDKFRSILLMTFFVATPIAVVGPVLNRRIAKEKADASKEVLRAVSFAAFKHRKQTRKSKESEPYIIHPVRVSELVATLGESGDNIPLLQAAILHDTVEDTDTTFEELEKNFGPKVSKLVREVSDDKSLAKEVRKQLQIEHAPKKSPEAKILSMADKVANLEDLLTKPNGYGIPLGWSVERVQNYCVWASAVAKGLQGEAKLLDQRLAQLISGEFEYVDGKRYPAIPAKDVSSNAKSGSIQ